MAKTKIEEVRDLYLESLNGTMARLNTASDDDYHDTVNDVVALYKGFEEQEQKSKDISARLQIAAEETEIRKAELEFKKKELAFKETEMQSTLEIREKELELEREKLTVESELRTRELDLKSRELGIEESNDIRAKKGVIIERVIAFTTIGVQIAGGVALTALKLNKYEQWMNTGFKFEETGNLISPTFKNFWGSLKPFN